MAEDNQFRPPNVFQKLRDALHGGDGAHLSNADVDLLFSLLGDEIGAAEMKFEEWKVRLEEYDEALTRRAGSSFHEGVDTAPCPQLHRREG